jgi:hypothetical protein
MQRISKIKNPPLPTDAGNGGNRREVIPWRPGRFTFDGLSPLENGDQAVRLAGLTRFSCRSLLHKSLNNEAMARAMPSSQTFDLTGLFWRRPEQKANSVRACVDGDADSKARTRSSLRGA